MLITDEQKRTLLDKGWSQVIVDDFAASPADEVVGPIAIGFSFEGGSFRKTVEALERDHPGVQSFSDRGLPIINITGTVSAMLGMLLDARTLTAEQAVARLRSNPTRLSR